MNLHISGSIKTLFAKFGVKQPEWSAQSPDFKLTEDILDEL